MISVLLYCLVLILVFGAMFYLIDLLPLQPPARTVARALLAVILLLILIDALFGLGAFRWPRLP